MIRVDKDVIYISFLNIYWFIYLSFIYINYIGNRSQKHSGIHISNKIKISE